VAAKKPFAGQLDRTVSVYRFEGGTDALGDPIETPVLLFTTRANEQSNSGSLEATEKMQKNTDTVYVIRKRNEPALFTREKLQLWENIAGHIKKLNIAHVERLERTHMAIYAEMYE
jgi:hypothetical protein